MAGAGPGEHLMDRHRQLAVLLLVLAVHGITGLAERLGFLRDP